MRRAGSARRGGRGARSVRDGQFPVSAPPHSLYWGPAQVALLGAPVARTLGATL